MTKGHQRHGQPVP